MDIDWESNNELLEVFKQSDVDKDGLLNEHELRQMLSDFDIDQQFAPSMLRVFSGTNHKTGVSLQDILDFFNVIMSGNIKHFFKMLFNAIDSNHDGLLESDDLVDFSSLVGDVLPVQAAKSIIDECDNDSDGSINFRNFWKWYKCCEKMAMSSEDDEDILMNMKMNNNTPYLFQKDINAPIHS
ncbi:EF hand family protein [Tritrichomonas foetus]|uniref:EF hand family protein n=1 Tax=Tritrichomonas foetus TaxID=1144522 RepID=A0A1J4KGM0_9EUKA|nr:EF hand family protein [Tritrichomonas foetus]|eukprot:OHT10513.1 EF hand family protein [Tritrichomonas foetus]